MHRIATPIRPVTVETAVSGVSTPSTIGQVFTDDAEPRFVVRWLTPESIPRSLGSTAQGGITAESVIKLIDLLKRQGIFLTNVEAI